MYRVLAFLAFFVVVGVCIRFSDSANVRRLFLASLLVPMLFCGVTGTIIWPMQAWHLYPDTIPESKTYYELRVADEDGTMVQYDARVAKPVLPTPVSRHARSIAVEYSASRRAQLSCYLLNEAREYRTTVGDRPFTRYLYFPPHQWGYKWTEDKLRNLQTITQLRVYQVRTWLTSDGQRIESTTKRLAYSINHSACS